ncbi:MAG: acetyl-coenzyme A synthetase N-terminal domain-containing protein, partial [Campylobacterota bacterium]|nr:acetyl-coenzyme A synthetase N-terminal domain-containing protein [Campylobacterota bacterium]
MSEIFNPKKEMFNAPLIKNMCEYQDLVDEFSADYEGTWAKFANEKIDWFKPYDKVLDESNAPFYKWFSGGELNVAHQCVDRHLATKKNKAAIIFEGDNGDQQILTYRELASEVNKTANMFKSKFGITKGDRVVIYMPMIPEAAI